MLKRIAVLTALILLIPVTVAAAVFANSVRSKTVTLSVDGETLRVKTVGDTVGEVLEEQGLDIGSHDAVAPSLGSAVENGSRIAIRFGRELSLTVDGDDHTYWVTATNVRTALDQIGRRFADAYLSASRSAPIGREGLDLTVKTEKTITLVDGGHRSREVTTGVTVGEALRDLRVPYDEDDEVVPGREEEVLDGSRVRVVHVDERTRRVEVPIPNQTVVRYDDSMAKGTEEVQETGRDGVRVDTYKVVLADGERRTREKVGSVVRTRPVDRVEVHGTKEVASPAPQPPTGGLSDAPCPSGSAVENGLTPNAISVHRAVCAAFPEVDTYLGLRVGDPDEHGQGRALDIMVYSDSALGDEISSWVRAHYQRLGVSEVIWSQHIWTVQRSSEGWRLMDDMGSATANHYDHVHVTVY